jgi:hypothetical protein
VRDFLGRRSTIDWVLVGAGGVAIAVATLTTWLTASDDNRAEVVLGILGLVVTFVSLNHAFPRRPMLDVYYRSHAGTNVIPATREDITVWLWNRGRGDAKHIVVHFATLGGTVYEANGLTQHRDEAEWRGDAFLLPAGQRYQIARLNTQPGHWHDAPEKAEWTTTAENLDEREDTVTLTREPPRADAEP